jgi:hypothetical protein
VEDFEESFSILKTTRQSQDGTETAHNLQDDPDPNRPENIKYIPQTYLETVCTERVLETQALP